MYKLIKSENSDRIICVYNTQTNTAIPLEESNTDYANFKKDLANGVELFDAAGNVIDGIAYLEELS